MGLFSTKNIQTTQVTSLSQDIDKTYADYSQVEGPQAKAIVDTEGNVSLSMNILDGGAIKESYKFAQSALGLVESSFGTVETALSNAKIAQMEGYSMAQDVLKGVISTQQSEATNVMLNVIKWGVLAVGIITVAWMIKQR